MREFTEQEKDTIRNLVRDAIRKDAGDMTLCMYWCWSEKGLATLKAVGHPEAVCYTDIGYGIALVVYLGDDLKPKVMKLK